MNRRTTGDLIRELQSEAVGAKLALLIVGFENNTLFVSQTDADPLRSLNAMIEAGGTPVGIARVIDTGSELRFTARPLAEFEQDDHIRGYLLTLMDGIRRHALSTGNFGLPE